MFIAHLPAGYLLSRAHPTAQKVRCWVLAGAIAPDADLAVFYLIHGGAVHHHSYLTHRPVVWLGVLIAGIALTNRRAAGPVTALGAGGLLHMLLDSVAGAIVWGWPITTQAHPWVIVPATQKWWVMSFVLHWTFALEILICTAAAVVWWSTKWHRPQDTP